MKYLISIILIFSASFVSGQQLLYPDIYNASFKTIHEFIPLGWDILDTVKADLNKDGMQDVAVVLQYHDTLKFVSFYSGKIVETQPRLMFILFKNNDSTYRRIDQTNIFILQKEFKDMQDPFKSISIKNGVLQISLQLIHADGSGDKITNGYKFRWQDGNFRLIGTDIDIIKSEKEEANYSYNFSNMQSVITKNDVNGKPIVTKSYFLDSYGPRNLYSMNPFRFTMDNNVLL